MCIFATIATEIKIHPTFTTRKKQKTKTSDQGSVGHLEGLGVELRLGVGRLLHMLSVPRQEQRACTSVLSGARRAGVDRAPFSILNEFSGVGEESYKKCGR